MPHLTDIDRQARDLAIWTWRRAWRLMRQSGEAPRTRVEPQARLAMVARLIGDPLVKRQETMANYRIPLAQRQRLIRRWPVTTPPEVRRFAHWVVQTMPRRRE